MDETQSAPTQRTAGSMLPGLVAASIRTGSPLATARSCSARSRGSSAASVATMSFPQTSTLMPCSAQKSTIDRLPARHIRAFRLPGR